MWAFLQGRLAFPDSRVDVATRLRAICEEQDLLVKEANRWMADLQLHGEDARMLHPRPSVVADNP